jgi:hypothetical protein
VYVYVIFSITELENSLSNKKECKTLTVEIEIANNEQSNDELGRRPAATRARFTWYCR